MPLERQVLPGSCAWKSPAGSDERSRAERCAASAAICQQGRGTTRDAAESAA